MSNKPAPKITSLSRPFWQGCNEGRLVTQRCTAADCNRYVYFPRVACPYCHRDSLEWQEVSGRGTVKSYTVVHRTHHEMFDPLVPYLFAAVELEEGPIVYARLRDADGTADLLNHPVRAEFEPHVGDQHILVFAPGTDR